MGPRSFSPSRGEVSVLQPQRTQTIVETSSAGAKARTDSKRELPSLIEEASQSSEPPTPPLSLSLLSPTPPLLNPPHESVKYSVLAHCGNLCVICGSAYSHTAQSRQFTEWKKSEPRAFLPCGHHFGISCLKKFLRTDAADFNYRCPWGGCLPVLHQCTHIAIPALQRPARFDLVRSNDHGLLPFDCEYCTTAKAMKLQGSETKHFFRKIHTESKLKHKYHDLRWKMKTSEIKLGHYMFKQKRFVKSSWDAFGHLLHVVVFRGQGEVEEEE